MAERPVERGRGQVAAEAERDQGQQGGGQPEASRVPSGGYAAPAGAGRLALLRHAANHTHPPPRPGRRRNRPHKRRPSAAG